MLFYISLCSSVINELWWTFYWWSACSSYRSTSDVISREQMLFPYIIRTNICKKNGPDLSDWTLDMSEWRDTLQKQGHLKTTRTFLGWLHDWGAHLQVESQKELGYLGILLTWGGIRCACKSRNGCLVDKKVQCALSTHQPPVER